MEKLLALFAPLIGWNTYLQKDKVSKATCTAVHDGLCSKLEIMQDDLKIIKEHLIGEKE